MADHYLWRGVSTTLDLTANWIDQTTGATPATTVPTGGTVTIGPVGLLQGIGPLSVAALTLEADLQLTGLLAAGTVNLLGGTVDLSQGGTLTVGTGAVAQSGTLGIGAGATLSGYGRILAPVEDDGVLAAQGGALALMAPVSGSGTLAIGAGATLFAASSVAAGITASFGSGATLELFTDTQGFAAQLAGFAAGDVLDVSDSTITQAQWSSGTLTLTGADGTTVALGLAGGYATTSFLALPDAWGGSDVVIPGTTVALGGVTVTIGSTSLVTLATGTRSVGILREIGTVAVASGSLNVSRLTLQGLLGITAGGTLTGGVTLSGTLAALDGGLIKANTLVLAGGTLSTDTLSAIALGGASLLAGSLDIAAAASAIGYGRIDAPLVNAGTVLASGGDLALMGAVSGAGTLAIGAGATLFAAGRVAAGTTAAFQGSTGTLELAGPGTLFGGTISGFASADAIEVGATLSGAVWQAGQLTLSSGGSVAAVLAMAGSYAGQSFAVASDGMGGSLVTLMACFAEGTRIATPAGEVPVEALRPGDEVLTPDGPRALVWVGMSRFDPAVAPEQRPVRILAGSFGPGRPARDLQLSPAHAVFLEGRLVPAVGLLDGARVRRDPATVLSYYHIAVETHALVYAEGLPVESLWPGTDLPPFDASRGTLPPPGPRCAPLLEQGPALAALRRRVLPLSGPLLGHVERILPDPGGTRVDGWALDATGRPVRLQIRRGGRRVGEVVANLWRADLDRAGLAGGRCGFRAIVPGPPHGLVLRRRGDGAVLPQQPGAEVAT
jgi:hypothetical protein